MSLDLRRLGLRRSHPAKLARRVALSGHPAVAGLLSGALPASADLAEWQPPCRDQGRSGSCTRGSTSSAYATAFAAAGSPLGYVPSQRVGYAGTRAIERAAAVPVGQPLPALQDTGAELADVFHFDATYGVLPQLVDKTPDGRLYDLWTDDDTGPGTGNVNDEPPFAALEQSAARIITGPYAIDPRASNASDLVAGAIAARMPVEIAGFVDTRFEQLGPNDVMGAPDQSDPRGGGHAIYFAAYRTQGSARQFRVQNSWGAGWCAGGSCWVDETFLHALWEIWPIALILGAK